jgi:hypothetical protein
MLEWITQRKSGELYTVINGDAVDGDIKNRSLQMITRNPASLMEMTADLLQPIAAQSEGLFMIRGTAAHVGPSAHLEESIAKDLDAVVCPETGAHSWGSLPLEVDGVLLDIAHHPGIGVGRNPWMAHNSIHTLAARVLFEYANDLRQIPNLVIRSHNHTYRDSRDDYRVRAITLPAWTLKTEYINMLNPSGVSDIGAVLVNCSAGYYECEVFLRQSRPAPVYSVRAKHA